MARIPNANDYRHKNPVAKSRSRSSRSQQAPRRQATNTPPQGQSTSGCLVYILVAGLGLAEAVWQLSRLL